MNINRALSQKRKDSDIKQEFISDQSSLTCNLTKPELRKRILELQKQIFSETKEIVELENGYTFHFHGDDEFLLKLMDYILSERKCCPFFYYELNIRSEKAVLKVTGAAGVKDLLKFAIDVNLKK